MSLQFHKEWREEMEISVADIPAETRWKIATQAMSGIMIAYKKAFHDVAGPEQFNKILEQIWGQAGQSGKQVADALGMKSDDAKSVAETWAIVSAIALGPELKMEIVEASKERTVLKGTGCPFLNRLKEYGITEDLLTSGDAVYCEALTNSLNPNVKITHEKRMHLGDSYCEWIFETK
jgi:hypothetical protein